MAKWGTWDEPDEVAVTLVVEDGHRMPLIGSDRIEAMRRMTACGRYTSQQIADALMIKRSYATRLAVEHGINLPSMQPPMDWSVILARPSAAKTRKQRAKQVV